jgi:hypothetical protein
MCLLQCTNRVNASGVAVQQWVSMVRDLLPTEFLETPKTHMHGGPPVVYVDAAASGMGRPYYLGVMHYWDVSGKSANVSELHCCRMLIVGCQFNMRISWMLICSGLEPVCAADICAEGVAVIHNSTCRAHGRHLRCCCRLCQHTDSLSS